MKMKIKWFYKGIRVRKFYRNVLWKMAGGFMLFPAIIGMVWVGWKVGFRYEVKDLAWIAGISVAIGITTSLLLFRLGIWQHAYNIQKLCQMCFDAIYYNLEGEEKEGKIVSGRKDMTYFPKLYYRYKQNRMYVAVKLDGSKYHAQFIKMADLLSAMFDMGVTSASRKYWYMVYTLEEVSEERIHLDGSKLVQGKNEVPLMKSLVWNFKRAPHALITGITGGGKSYLLQYLINMLKNMGADIRIIDPKMSDLYNLRYILGNDKVKCAPGGIAQMLRETVAEMDDRYKKMDGLPFGSDYETIGLSPVFVVFDEFVAYIQTLQKAEDRKNLISSLIQIVLKGRQAGVYLIFATQRADAECLPGAIRDNLGLRVSLGGLEKEGYRMTFGSVDQTLEKFEPGHGYVYISGKTDTVREFYAPFIGNGYDPVEHLKEIVKRTDSPVRRVSDSSGSDKGEFVRFCEGEAEAEQGQKFSAPHH